MDDFKCPLTGKPCDKAKEIHVSQNIDGNVQKEFDCCQQCEIFGSLSLNPLLQVPKGFVLIPSETFAPGVQLMNNLAKLNSMEKEILPITDIRCKGCNISLIEIQATGRFGCSKCYQTFRNEIEPYLPQMQGGNVRHLGKRPKNAIGEDLETLNLEIQKAIKDERYEDAAKIRDRIAELKKTFQSSDLESPNQGIKENTV